MITSKQLKEIKEYHVSEYMKFLCNSAEDLGLLDEFRSYLMSNLDNTMKSKRKCPSAVRWDFDDQESRVNWLDKHIEILHIQEKEKEGR